ncbi:MAG: HpcH/HpaI aldolase family protein [Acidimicrobiales bacterium]
MRENALRGIWQQGGAALGGWLTVPSAMSAEIFANCGFDWVCVDMQHGLIDEADMIRMLQGISSTETVPLVRVPRNEAGIIGKCLDAGAWGVIVPMVCSRAEAQAAVSACRYAPVGIRSYGPLRANYYAGFDYFERANDEVLCVVMVETRGAVADVEEIVSVPGVDAVYIGPADLSVTLGLPPGPDNSDAAFSAALDRVLDACRRHHVVPGIAGNASTAGKRLAQGFRLVEVASDAGLLAQGAGAALAQVRPDAGSATKSAYL